MGTQWRDHQFPPDIAAIDKAAHADDSSSPDDYKCIVEYAYPIIGVNGTEFDTSICCEYITGDDVVPTFSIGDTITLHGVKVVVADAELSFETTEAGTFLMWWSVQIKPKENQ